MVLISENNVLRVKELVSVAPRHQVKIKIFPSLSRSSVDQPFLICYVANKLPSSSLAYRMGSGMKQVNSPVTMTPAECMENNLDLETYSSSYAASQKMENWHMQLLVSDCISNLLKVIYGVKL